VGKRKGTPKGKKEAQPWQLNPEALWPSLKTITNLKTPL
jgi:hypothetical protein